VSCTKLPVLGTTVPLAEDDDEADPVPQSCSAVTLGPEIAVFAGITLPPGQVTATPVLHGPTPTDVGVGICAWTKLATAAEKAVAIITVRLRKLHLAVF
jgi:hypothetical protein